MATALDAQLELLRTNVTRFNGFEIMDEGDSLSIVFHSSLDAMKFAIMSQEDLMECEWPEELYDHPSAAMDGLYKGLRVRMACAVGYGEKFMNKTTNRLSYTGPAVVNTAAILKAVVDGGIVVASAAVLQELHEKWPHRLYELGEIHVQDIGTFVLPKMEPANEAVGLVQVMPESLKERPPTDIQGGRMTMRPYDEAPGTSNDGDALAFVFASFVEADRKNDKGQNIEQTYKVNPSDAESPDETAEGLLS